MKWDALASYFLSEFEDNNEKTKDDSKATQAVRLVTKFNDPFTKLYALFVQSIMPSFDAYNIFLQSEEPFVHLLQGSTLNLYKALLFRFITPDVIAQSDDILCIDIEDSTNYKEYSSIHIRLLGLRSIPNILGKPNNFILRPAAIY